MIRLIVGLLMVFIGVGTMDSSSLAGGFGAGLYMTIAGLAVMACGLRGMAKRNSDFLE